MPVLVTNGSHDVLWPSSRSWELYRYIENAQLIDMSEGQTWVFVAGTDMFGRDVNQFSDAEEWDKLPTEKL